MRERSRRAKTRRGSRWLVLCAAAAALAGTFAGCQATVTSQPPVTAEQEMSPDPPAECAAQQLYQRRLEQLAMGAMETFGRIDPFLFERSDSGELLAPKDTSEPRRQFRENFEGMLKRIQAEDPEFAGRFLEGQAAARKVCGEIGCPRNEYTIHIERRQLANDDGSIDYFEVEGENRPSDSEWQSFLRQYTFAEPRCFPYVPLIRLYEPGLAPSDKSKQSRPRTHKGKGMNVRDGNCQEKKRDCGGCGTLVWEDMKDGDFCCQSTC